MGNPNFILPLALSHMPQRVHDQEKLYSPPLRSIAGGYSYMPTMAEQTEAAREYSAKYDKRYPNPDFMLDLPEPPKNTPENVKEGQQERGQDRGNCITDGNIKKCRKPGTNLWFDVKGNPVSPPRGIK
jgi:hypothetical protein